MIKIVADQMLGVGELLSVQGDLNYQLEEVDGRQIKANLLDEADALLIRSVTQVDANLLESSSVQFVGSATIGHDHVDLDWL